MFFVLVGCLDLFKIGTVNMIIVNVVINYLNFDFSPKTFAPVQLLGLESRGGSVCKFCLFLLLHKDYLVHFGFHCQARCCQHRILQIVLSSSLVHLLGSCLPVFGSDFFCTYGNGLCNQPLIKYCLSCPGF